VTVPRVYRIGEATEVADEEDWVVDPGCAPVLVVEDDPADAFAMRRLLTGTCYQPIFVRTVAAAKRAFERVTPTVILLDIVLLGDEAWRMILGVRGGEATGNIPIIVTSSVGEERKALHLGADAYLPKPIDASDLLDRLDRLTGNRSVTRVLVIDDEEVARYLIRQLLPRGVYDVQEATTGTEGLARLLTSPPDILLLDLKMPEMNGFELLERVSREVSLGSIPAIVLTSAVLSPGERQRLGRAARIMSKSDLSAAALTGAIADVLGGSLSEAR
jgi:CheY-like chemotaxis protein